MRLLLFSLILLLGFTTSLTGQSIFDTDQEIKLYVQENIGSEIPNESQLLEKFQDSYEQENQKLLSEEEARDYIRKSYWENLFLKENQSNIAQAKKAGDNTNTAAAGAVPNPPLSVFCAPNVVVIVDRSSSINPTERVDIINGLINFVGNIDNTGINLTIIGMGNCGAGAVTSNTITYDGNNVNTHIPFINAINFTGNQGNNDSWRSGLEVATNFAADLVLIITDGDNSHGDGEAQGSCQAANQIKNAGGHLFVFGDGTGNYGSDLNGGCAAGAGPNGTNNFASALINSIDPNPVFADIPPTAAAIGQNDFIDFAGDFSTLGEWLSTVALGLGNIQTTYIGWPRECLLDSFTITGVLDVCSPLTVESVELQICQNGAFTGVTVEATINNNGTWIWRNTMQSLVALGLEFGECYDVKPIMTLSDGSIIIGEELEVGQNNDMCFGDQSDPKVIVNDDPFNGDFSKTQFCEGSPIYYHGTDPLSGSHHTYIQRRPIGSTDPFAFWQGAGSIGQSLDGYTGNLFTQYGAWYFAAGWEYKLTVASMNLDPEVCIAWTEEVVYFEVVDCCEFTVDVIRTPLCTSEGDTFGIRVEILAPINPADIEEIFSSDSNFTVVDYELGTQTDSSLFVNIFFVSNNCSCGGEMINFDIVTSCTSVWVMTDKIPCCLEPCEKTEIVKWETGECVIVNGQPAREFCLEIDSESTFLGVTAGSNTALCQVELENLEITDIPTNGNQMVCGYMVFSDPECTFFAEVTLTLESRSGCCSLSQKFSFPKECNLSEECLRPAPEVQIIYGNVGLGSAIHVSIGIAQGDEVTVENVLNGTSTTHTVSTVYCYPWSISQNGQVYGQPCNGIILYGSVGEDCSSNEENPNPSSPYHYIIKSKNCKWVLAGDYCEEYIVYPERKERSEEVETDYLLSNKVTVYPNPVDQSGILNFDLGNTKSIVTEVVITDIGGKIIASFLPASGQNTFQYQLTQPLPKGIYLTILRFEDGTIKSAKLVAVE